MDNLEKDLETLVKDLSEKVNGIPDKINEYLGMTFISKEEPKPSEEEKKSEEEIEKNKKNQRIEEGIKLLEKLKTYVAKIATNHPDSADALVRAFDTTYMIDEISEEVCLPVVSIGGHCADIRNDIAEITVGYSTKKHKRALVSIYNTIDYLIFEFKEMSLPHDV